MKFKSYLYSYSYVYTVKPLFKGAVNRPLNRGNPLNGGHLCTSMYVVTYFDTNLRSKKLFASV